MTSTALSYALITPLRNEAGNLRRLTEAIDSQSRPPLEWVIVDNGSIDETLEVAQDFAVARPWVRVISVPAESGPPRPGAPIVRAFHAGMAVLDCGPDVVVKLDADISMPGDHFEHLLDAFDRDPSLGIASGTCLEERGGHWVPVQVARGHVRGAVRAYRRECLDQVLPLEERVGWDGIDELKAAVLGWTTRMLPEIAFFHHRPLGVRDGAPSARWRAQGEAAHYMGYRFPYLVLRSLHHARRQRVALAMISSFVGAAVRREPRYEDPAVRAYLRRKQRLRTVARERIVGKGGRG